MRSARKYLLQLKRAERPIRSRLCGTVQLFDYSADHRSDRVPKQRTTTLADRRPFHASPVTHTRFIQFPYQKTVRQPCLLERGHVRVAGLPKVSAKLTISQSPKKKTRLLSVSVRIPEIQRFRATPTTAIRRHDALGIPMNPIRHQYLSRPLIHVGHFDAHAQIPLLHPVDRQRLAVPRRNRRRELLHLLLDALEDDLAIELQVADVTAIRPVLVFQIVDVILNFRTGIKTVEGELAQHALGVTEVDQLDRQLGHLLELLAGPFALIRLFETTEFQWIPFATDRIQVVDDDQILGVLVSLFGMIPERTAVLDELAGLVDENIIIRASLTASTSQSTSVMKRLRQDWSEALGSSSVIPATVVLSEIIKPVK